MKTIINSVKRLRVRPAITALVIALLLTSCGTIQKVFNKTSKKEAHKSDSTSLVKKDSSGTLKTTVTETIDTSGTTKGDLLSSSQTLEELEGGDTVTADDGKLQIKVALDKKTGKIHEKAIVKPQAFKIQARKTIVTEQADIVKTTIQAEVKKADKIQSKNTSVLTKRTLGIPWWVWPLAILLLIGAGFFTIKKLEGKI